MKRAMVLQSGLDAQFRACNFDAMKNMIQACFFAEVLGAPTSRAQGKASQEAGGVCIASRALDVGSFSSIRGPHGGLHTSRRCESRAAILADLRYHHT